MKVKLFVILMSVSLSAFAQKKIEETLSTTGIKEVKMVFKYPELVRISSWDKNEVSINGTAMINHGENDDAFKIKSEKDGSILSIYSLIEDHDNLPKRIMIKRDGEKYYFPTDDFNDPSVQQFIEEHGGQHQYQMHGVIKEIELEIKVPRSMVVSVESKYGLVEAVNITAPLTIDAKYGGIDVSLDKNTPRNVTARTRYGELFSDLDLAIDRSNSTGGEFYKWTTVVANLNGGGSACMLTSKYGNVYIRKQ